MDLLLYRVVVIFRNFHSVLLEFLRDKYIVSILNYIFYKLFYTFSIFYGLHYRLSYTFVPPNITMRHIDFAAIDLKLYAYILSF